MKNYYEIIGVKRGTSETEIDRKTYELGKSLHPKKAKTKFLDSKKFEEIIEAHSILSDTRIREIYDWIIDQELGNQQLRDVGLTKHRRELELAINHGIRRGREYVKEPFWVFKDDFSNSMWWSRWDIFSLWPF